MTKSGIFAPGNFVVDTNMGCYIWVKALTRKGYPVAFMNGKTELICRIIMEAKGDLCVVHHCEIRNCINPAHMYLVTGIERRRMYIKGKPGQTKAIRYPELL